MELLNLILPLFVVIAIGYGLKKTKFVDEKSMNDFNKIIFYVALPLMLLSLTSKVSLQELLNAYVIGGFVLSVIIGAILWTILAKICIKKKTQAAFIQTGFRSNLAYFGLPITLTALGESALGSIAIIVGIGTVLNTIIAIIVFTHAHVEKKSDLIGYIKKVLYNPLIIGIMLGAILSGLHISLPTAIQSTIDLIAQIGLPAILLIVGYSISFQKLKAKLSLNLLNAACKLIGMPLIAWILMTYILNAPTVATQVVVLMTAAPTAVVSQSFAKEFRGDQQFTAAAVSFNMLAAFITIPLIILLIV